MFGVLRLLLELCGLLARPGIGLEMGCELCRVLVLRCLLCSWTLFQGRVARFAYTQLWRLGSVVGLWSAEGSLIGVLSHVGREVGVVG